MNKVYQNLSKDYENAPKHESMRVRVYMGEHGWVCHRSSLFYREAYTWIEKFLEASVGKKFDKVYSKVCDRFRKNKYLQFRETFKSRIDPKPIEDHRWHNEYYLDKNRIIRKYKSLKTREPKKYVLELNRDNYYMINKENFIKYSKVMLYLRNTLGRSIDYIVSSGDRLNEELGKKVEDLIVFALEKYYFSEFNRRNGLKTRDFIQHMHDSQIMVYYKGSPGYSKHIYEQLDAKRKAERMYYKEEEEKHERMLRESLYFSKRKAKSEELERKQSNKGLLLRMQTRNPEYAKAEQPSL